MVGVWPTGTLYQLSTVGHHFTGHCDWSTAPQRPSGSQ